MSESVPPGTRSTSRVILLNGLDQILLLHAQDPEQHKWWIAPGGGLAEGESFEEAAKRELFEETGSTAAIGNCVWTRRHIYDWDGRRHDQYERFFVARTEDEVVAPRSSDSYIIGYRWWSVSEIEHSSDVFAPRQLAELLVPVLRGEYPETPIDCGI